MAPGGDRNWIAKNNSGTRKYISDGYIMVKWDAFPETDIQWTRMPDDFDKLPAGTKDLG